MNRLILLLPLGLIAAAAPAAEPAKAAPPVMPVSVSSANYTETPSAELFDAVHDKPKVNPVETGEAPRRRDQSYVFAPGDLFSRDLSYEDICRQLEPALAKRGFHPAADAQGRVADPAKIDLVLRLTVGTRYWRDPTVRLEQLTWKQGLEPKVWSQITLNGGQTTFDRRRGGDDDALSKVGAIQDSQEGSGVLGAGGGNSKATYANQGNVNTVFEYNSTREFFILVIDAFSYAELLEKGDRAKRQWTTFIAMPRQDKELFSAVLPTLVKVGTPYFGETTRGLQMFDDARATIDIGTPTVVETDVKSDGRR